MDMDRGITTVPAMDILPMAIDRTAAVITVHTAIRATDITKKDGITVAGIQGVTTDMPVIITRVTGNIAVIGAIIAVTVINKT